MANNKEKYVTVEKAQQCADDILLKMKVATNDNISNDPICMPWIDWWASFIVPNDFEPYMNYEEHRHVIKNLINKEFVARQKSNRLFVAPTMGVFMLDGQNAVGAKYLLSRVKKQASITKTSIQNCYELSQANGLTMEESRMLQNAVKYIDSNLTLLAGAIGRMKSLPKPVKRLALHYLGVDVD